MENKKKLTIGLIIGLIALLSGISYAYFTATFQNLGERETSISTETLGNLKLTGETVFTSENLYPGEMGVQEFSIEPVSQGKGIYELDLNAVVPSEFGGDIFITLYRATSNEASVTVTEGELTQEGDNYYKQDTLSTSNVEIIYPASSLTNNSQIVLFQTEFDETLTNTKYYLVYDYRNRGTQNNQMGKSFSATISGRLVKELNGAGVIAKLAGNAPRNSTALIDNGEVLDGEEVICTNTLAYDDFGNLRYVGENPCNYVTFNGESPSIEDVVKYYVHVNNVSTTSLGLNEADSMETCESEIANIARMVDGTVECALNPETNKYYMLMNGNIITKYFNTNEECESNKPNVEGTSCVFQNEKNIINGWRIIGILDNQIKMVRNNLLGEYALDTSASNVNSGIGINQWGESGEYKGADLMKLLNPGFDNNLAEDASGNVISGTYTNNSLYWNRGTGNCYSEPNNAYEECNFSETGLKSESKTMIDNHIWYLGSQGNNNVLTKGNKLGLAKKFYEYERSNNSGKICTQGNYCNDTVNRTTIWKGYIGLLNSSDYGYAVGGVVRTNCLENANLIEYNNNCYSNDWLFNSRYQWTLSPLANSSTSAVMSLVVNNNYVFGGYLAYKHGVRPTLFLKSNVRIVSGEGTPTNPYTLSIE